MSEIKISEENARLPQIPQTAITDPQVRPVVEAVRTIFNKRAFGSDPLDRWVTWRDMVANNVVTYEAGGNSYSGGGRPSFFISNAEEEDLTAPPAPTNLQASGALLNVILTWDPPKYRNHAYTEIWRSGDNNLGTAVMIATTQAAIYSDPVGSGLTYYYWIRYVSTANITGSYNSTLGVQGQTSPDPGYLLELLTGQIQESQLYSSLGERIDLIDAEGTGVVSQVNQLNDQYTVKIDNNGYVTGFGLASTAVNGTPFSEFAIRADRFYIASPSGPGITPIIPFVVNTTAQTINGVNVPIGVYMDAAFIKNGTITNAKIGNATIDDAKIASLNASKITAGSIAVDSFIGSPNYVAGSQGWRISGTGIAEFSNVTVRGTVYATAGQFIGTLLGGAANGYTSGVGLYSGGDTAGNYRWRVGAPNGARIQWTGSSVEVYNASNVLTLSSGGVTWDTVSSKPAFGAMSYIDSITAANVGTYIGSAAIGEAYIGTITAAKIDSRNLTIRDAANNVIFSAANNLDWGRVANVPAGVFNSNITINSNGTLTGGGGGQVSLGGLGAGGFAFLNQINSGNVGTYIATAAIGGAYIQNAAIGTALIADAAIVSAKIGDAQVDTLRIAGNAVTTMGTLGGTTNQTIYLNAPYGGQLAVTMWVGESPDGNFSYNPTVRLFVDGTERLSLVGAQIYAGSGGGGDGNEFPVFYRSTESKIILVTLAAGTHSVSVTSPTYFDGTKREYTAVCLLTQR